MTAGTPKRIFIVDDEEDVVEALQFTIEDEGYEVITAMDAQDALEKAFAEKFDAAVLDVSMGAIGGLDIARKLRTDPSTAHIPIVILTGLDESVVREQFSSSDLFVSKGADLHGLGKQLAALIGRNDGILGDPKSTSSPL